MISKECCETGVTSYSGMYNFGHIEAINVIFFWKCSEFYLDFENGKKVPESVDGFEDKSVWSCSEGFCQLWQ